MVKCGGQSSPASRVVVRQCSLSRDSAYAVRLSVTVAPVTTRIRGIPVEVALGPDDGLPMESVANLDDITTISKSSLESRITVLSSEKLQAVERALRFALGLAT